ncbi:MULTISPECIES: hypothetical protein [Pseudomonas]|uniref:Lipoprotein n=2 Tax=Pseudomonas TaxID=286 RepID=A0AAW4BT42_PSEPU|nr:MULTISPECIES: hypothetical protein [Pseudomonas]MBF8647506.1 hypothetical protein [Pseudomonas pudica]MBF8702678.1 hypothetical protein [Pseudomonas putida]MBF8735432.1 hypothetical protein [Pseudomonas putida]MBF8762448.1 hypothetical protein [Pseudomonas pudica]MDZ5112432.1 hypothetical protein [Pseudomonas putida]
MKIKTAALLSLLALVISGCDQLSGESNKADNQAAEAVRPSQPKAELNLADGSILLLSAEHMKSYAKPNSAGKLSMHEYSYTTADKLAENDVYMQLQNAGFTRKVISNDSSQFKVQYYKKDLPVIGGIYTTVNNKNIATIATLYWQEK